MKLLNVLALLAVVATSAGCQTQSSGGVAYGPPCSPRAYDAGCPYVGYRQPIQL